VEGDEVARWLRERLIPEGTGEDSRSAVGGGSFGEAVSSEVSMTVRRWEGDVRSKKAGVMRFQGAVAKGGEFLTN
jgi:hypothetical protein